VSLGAFSEKSQEPTDKDLAQVLGKAYAPWVRLLAVLAEQIEPMTQVWAYGGARYGWSLRVRYKDRVIVYMMPQDGQFLASFALGEKAVAAARAAKLPAAVLSAIDAAPKYAEGRGVRLEVRSVRQVASVARLAQIKRAN
jgi:hypothetical protein